MLRPSCRDATSGPFWLLGWANVYGMTATAKAAAARPPVVVPEAPPSDIVSFAKQKTAPNWAIKTVMAATGALLAAMLVVRLIINLWLYAGAEHYDAVTWRLHTFLTPYLPQDGWLWIVRGLTLALALPHFGLSVVLVRRGHVARGAKPAKLHHGWDAWLTRLMPYTGVVIALFTCFYLIDQVGHGFSSSDGRLGSYQSFSASLSIWWVAVVYIIGLLAIVVHVARGLTTVLTIAAGNGVAMRRLRDGAVFGGGLVFAALILANILAVIGLLGGWL